MNNMEYVVDKLNSKLNDIKSLNQFNNFNFDEFLDGFSLKRQLRILNKVLDVQRRNKKRCLIDRNHMLKDYNDGYVTKEEVKSVCDKFNLAEKRVLILDQLRLELKRKLKTSCSEQQTKPQENSKKDHLKDYFNYFEKGNITRPNIPYEDKLMLNDEYIGIINNILGYSIYDKIHEFDLINNTLLRLETIKNYKYELYHVYFVPINRYLKKLKDDDTPEKYYLNKCKIVLDKVLQFLNKYIRSVNSKYNAEIREIKRRETTDLKSLPPLSECQESLLDDINNGVEIYIDNINDFLISISYFIKKYNFAEDNNLLLNYIDQALDIIKLGTYDYDSYVISLNFLKNTIKYKISSYDKKKDSDKRKILKQINSKLNSVSYINVNYTLDELVNMEKEEDMKKIFKKLIYENKNPLFVKQLLDERPDLCYLTNYKDQYFFNEVLEYYINIVLNSKESNPDIVYYGTILDYYIDNMLQFEDKYIHTTLLKRFNKVIEIASSYDVDKRNYVINMVGNIINKITGTENQLQDISNHIEVNNASNIITLDNNKAKILENAFNIEKNPDGSWDVNLYVTNVVDITSNDSKNNFSKVFQRFFSEKRLFDKKYAIENLSLRSGEKRKVIGYHFTLDKDMNIINLEVKKEFIKVYRNVTYKDTENIEDPVILEQINNFLNVASKIQFSDYKKVGKNKMDNLNCKFNTYFNKYIATKCFNEQIPFVYTIVQRHKNQILFDELVDSCDVSYDGKQMIDNLEESYNNSLYTPHVLENSTIYGSSTSPVRNIASLINQIYAIPYLTFKRDFSNKVADITAIENICSEINEANKEKLSKDELSNQIQKLKSIWS